MNRADLDKLFAPTGNASKDELATRYRAAMVRLSELAPANKQRQESAQLLAASFRKACSSFDIPLTDADIATAKLAELFPDGDIPGTPANNPIIRLANAVEALKGEKR